MGGDYFLGKIVDRWNSANQSTTSSTVTKAAVAGKSHVVSSISGSSDSASTVTLESPANTVLWRGRCAAGGSYAMTWPPGVMTCAVNTAVRVVVATGSSACESNIAGFSIRG